MHVTYISQAIAQFLLSEWIWSVTFALGMVPIAIVLMFILFWAVERYSMLKAFMLSLVAQVFALSIFSSIVIGLLVKLLGVEMLADQAVLGPLAASLSLALIYTILEGCFFWIVSTYSSVYMARALLIAAFSNVMAALLIYLRL